MKFVQEQLTREKGKTNIKERLNKSLWEAAGGY